MWLHEFLSTVCMQVPVEARENWIHLELELKAVMSHPPSVDSGNSTLKGHIFLTLELPLQPPHISIWVVKWG